MKKSYALFSIMLTLLCLFIGPIIVDAETIFRPGPGLNDGTDNGSINAGKDTMVSGSTPTTNYGSAASMSGLPQSTCNPATAKAYIEFDLSSLPSDVQQVFLGVTHFPHTVNCYSNCDADFYFYSVMQPWNEMTLTFNNMPYDRAIVYGPVKITFPNDMGNREYDITNIYRNWKTGLVQNYGLSIYSTTVGCNNAAVMFNIHSSDDPSENLRPYLRIVSPPAALDAPKNMRYTLSSPMLTLNWDSVGGASGYKLGIGLQPGTYFGPFDFGNITQLGPLDISSLPADTYYFTVKAYNNTQESGYSNEIAVVVPPQAPKNMRYTLSGSMLTLNWDAVAGASGYKLGIGLQASTYFGPFDFGNITQLGPLDISSLAAGTYYFAVKAYNAAQEGGYSNEIALVLGGTKTIQGPGGSSIITAAGSGDGGTSISIGSVSAAGLTEGTEVSVSQAISIAVSGTEPLTGNGMFIISMPVNGTGFDPEKLSMKVKYTSGLLLPVRGTYDPATNTYRIEIPALSDGLVMAVVVNQNIKIVRGEASSAKVENKAELTLASSTPKKWDTCDWEVIDHTGTVPDSEIQADILPAAKKACEALSSAGFRSPRLWIDRSVNPIAWTLNFVINAQHDAFYQPSDISDNSIVSVLSRLTMTEDQKLRLGQIFIDYARFKSSILSGWTWGDVLMHELFHGVQQGYDFKASGKSAFAYMEGTATAVGKTHEVNNGSITGPTAYVMWKEICCNGAFAMLYRGVDEFYEWGENADYYSKQDFFVYVTNRFLGGSFAWLDQLFEYMSSATSGKYGLSDYAYLPLYRQGMNAYFTTALQKSLSDVYAEYAIDRAYKHSSFAMLRPDDANTFKPNKLAEKLFANPHDVGLKTIDIENSDADRKKAFFQILNPLQTVAVKMQVPASYRTSAGTTIPLTIILGGVLKAEGIRIVIFRQDDNGVMVAGGQMDITDISKPVDVPVNKDIASLTILVLNCYVEDYVANVTIKYAPVPKYVLLYLSGVHTYLSESLKVPPDWPTYNHTRPGNTIAISVQSDMYAHPHPLTWNGNAFSVSFTDTTAGSTDTINVTGSLSADGKTLEDITATHQWIGSNAHGMTQFSARNLPQIWASPPWFEVSGSSAQGLVTVSDVTYTPASGNPVSRDTYQYTDWSGAKFRVQFFDK